MKIYNTSCKVLSVLCIVLVSGCYARKSADYYRQHPDEAKKVFGECAKKTPDERYENPDCLTAAKGLNRFYWDKAPRSLEKKF